MVSFSSLVQLKAMAFLSAQIGSGGSMALCLSVVSQPFSRDLLADECSLQLVTAMGKVDKKGGPLSEIV